MWNIYSDSQEGEEDKTGQIIDIKKGQLQNVPGHSCTSLTVVVMGHAAERLSWVIPGFE